MMTGLKTNNARTTAAHGCQRFSQNRYFGDNNRNHPSDGASITA